MNDFNYDDDLEAEQQEDKNAQLIADRLRKTNNDIQKRLRVIVRKGLEELTIDDKKFLKARASLLSRSDREAYADIINSDYSGTKVAEDNTPVEVPLEKLTRTILEAKASELGIENPDDTDVFPNKQSLIDAINAAS